MTILITCINDLDQAIFAGYYPGNKIEEIHDTEDYFKLNIGILVKDEVAKQLQDLKIESVSITFHDGKDGKCGAEGFDAEEAQDPVLQDTTEANEHIDISKERYIIGTYEIKPEKSKSNSLYSKNLTPEQLEKQWHKEQQHKKPLPYQPNLKIDKKYRQQLLDRNSKEKEILIRRKEKLEKKRQRLEKLQKNLDEIVDDERYTGCKLPKFSDELLEEIMSSEVYVRIEERFCEDEKLQEVYKLMYEQQVKMKEMEKVKALAKEKERNSAKEYDKLSLEEKFKIQERDRRKKWLKMNENSGDCDDCEERLYIRTDSCNIDPYEHIPEIPEHLAKTHIPLKMGNDDSSCHIFLFNMENDMNCDCSNEQLLEVILAHRNGNDDEDDDEEDDDDDEEDDDDDDDDDEPWTIGPCTCNLPVNDE